MNSRLFLLLASGARAVDNLQKLNDVTILFLWMAFPIYLYGYRSGIFWYILDGFSYLFVWISQWLFWYILNILSS